MTTFNCQGLPTLVTVPSGAETMPRSYDATGCPILPTAILTGALSSTIAAGVSTTIDAQSNTIATNLPSSSAGQATTTILVTSTRYHTSGTSSNMPTSSTVASLPALASVGDRNANQYLYVLLGIAIASVVML